MPQLEIEIWTDDKELISELKALGDGGTAVTPEVRVVCDRVQEPEVLGPDGMSLVALIIQFASGVAAGVIANWLYDQLRERKTHGTINKHYFSTTEAGYETVVRRKFKELIEKASVVDTQA